MARPLPPALIGLVALAGLIAMASSASADPPPDAFCIVAILPGPGFQQVRVVVDEESDSPYRAGFWQDADADGDGQINRTEMDHFRDTSLRFLPGGRDMGNDSLALQLGNFGVETGLVNPIYASSWRQVGHGIPGVSSGHHPVGPVIDDYDQFETQTVREYTFDAIQGASYAVLVGGHDVETVGAMPDITYLPQVSIEYVVVQAPAGWLVDTIEGYSYDGHFKQTYRTAQVDLAGFDTSVPWTIRFVQDGGFSHPPITQDPSPYDPRNDIPAMGAALTPLVLVGLAIALRRRNP